MFNLFVILLILFVEICLAADYQLIFKKDNFIEKCPGKENNFIDQGVDFSKLKMTRDDEDTIYWDGTLQSILDIKPTDVVEADLGVLKLSAGKWLQVVTLVRKHLCSVIFLPGEPWYGLIENIPVESRKCPPKYMDIVSFNHTKMHMIVKNIQDRNAGGEYKCVLNLKLASRNITACAMTYMELIMV